jgi:O-antigen/teichoic acid export membrane protein
MQVSVVQLAVALAALGAAAAAGVAPLWVPFTALALANVVSLAVGAALAWHDGSRARRPPPPARSLARLGGWLVLSTQGEQIAGFAAAALLGALAGAASVGQFEAARQLAQPLFVVSVGVQSVLRPRVMAAARAGDEAEGRRYSLVFAAVVVACGATYALVAGVPWPGNPLVALFPNAFELRGMVTAFVLASTLAFVLPILAVQAIAAGRHRDIVRINLTNHAVYLVCVVALARSVGALAIPIASALYCVLWLVRFRPVMRAIYRNEIATILPPGAGEAARAADFR